MNPTGICADCELICYRYPVKYGLVMVEMLCWPCKLSRDIHVVCDDECKALKLPNTPAEVIAALEHWRDHNVSGGCSHGC